MELESTARGRGGERDVGLGEDCGAGDPGILHSLRSITEAEYWGVAQGVLTH